MVCKSTTEFDATESSNRERNDQTNSHLISIHKQVSEEASQEDLQESERASEIQLYGQTKKNINERNKQTKSIRDRNRLWTQIRRKKHRSLALIKLTNAAYSKTNLTFDVHFCASFFFFVASSSIEFYT